MRFDEDKVESLLLEIISAERKYVDDGDYGPTGYHYECPFCEVDVNESDIYMKDTKHYSDCYITKARLILYPEEFL